MKSSSCPSQQHTESDLKAKEGMWKGRGINAIVSALIRLCHPYTGTELGPSEESTQGKLDIMTIH